MKKSTLSLSILPLLFLTGCISSEVIEQKLAAGFSPKGAGQVCFDIGNGIYSNGLTDNYWEALEVADGLSCVKELAERRSDNEEMKAFYIFEVLSLSADKSFLPDDVLETIKVEAKAYEKLAHELLSKRALKEEKERIKIRKQEKEEASKIAAIHDKKTLELCGNNSFGIGDNEECLLHYMGQPTRMNTTHDRYGTRIQYIYKGYRTNTYVYTQNGIITTIQN